MKNVSAGLAEFNSATVNAYIDTIELFFPRRSRPKLPYWVTVKLEECPDQNGNVWGYRAYFNQPDRHTIVRLDRVARECDGIVCRFDLAIDIQPHSPERAGEIKRRILRTAVLRWRKVGYMLDFENGNCWVQWRKGEKRYSRNLELYADRHNRFTGEVDCVHLELRFLRANTIRKQGIHSPRDLLQLNPKELFDKHVAFSKAGEEHVRDIVRRHVKEDREKYKGRTTSAFLDQYRASIHRKIKRALIRLQLDRAQIIRDRMGKITKVIPRLFELPCTLVWDWGAMKTFDNFEKDDEVCIEHNNKDFVVTCDR